MRRTTSGGDPPADDPPLGLAIAPYSDILTVNAGRRHIVETSPAGTQVDDATLDGTGLLFGLAVRPDGSPIYFANGTNTLGLAH